MSVPEDEKKVKMSEPKEEPEDEDDDYMSDAFLVQCGDNRPGLVSKQVALKRKRETISKARAKRLKESKPKSTLAEKEAKIRNDGLKIALLPKNKGFAMLTKMGYTPGTAIGKRGEGRTEPVPIEVKTNRGGMGLEADLKRKAEAWSKARAMVAFKRRRFEELTTQEFIFRRYNKHVDRQSESDLYKSQKVCGELDEIQKITEPAESFFWPPREVKDEDGEDKEEYGEGEDTQDPQPYLSTTDKLEIVTDYLREKYTYCLWCGIQFTDFADMAAECPGNTYTAHNS